MYPTLEAALNYAAGGFRVLPLKPQSKIPDLRHWPEEASSDAATVRRHFAASEARAGSRDPWTTENAPGHYPNVGIATGHGLVVIDVDMNHGGERPDWAPPTLTARTPNGGLHLYYAVPKNGVPNSVGRIAPGVDIRGERGMVAASPSTTPEGRYAWVNEDAPIAQINPDLVIPDDLKQSYAGRRVRGFQWADECPPEGTRNNYLTSLAGHLFATGHSFQEVLAGLLDESDAWGFTPKPFELDNIVKSVARYHVAA